MFQHVNPPPRRRPAPLQGLPVLPVTIIGVDASLTSTGIAIYRKGTITTSIIQMENQKVRGVARLAFLRHKLQTFLASIEEPFIFGIEGYSFGSKNSRPHSIGEWGGIAKLELMWKGEDGYIVPPKTLKMFMTENGNSPKPIVRLHLRERYAISIEQDDEADAACVSIVVGASRYGVSFPDLTSVQHKALAAVEHMV